MKEEVLEILKPELSADGSKVITFLTGDAPKEVLPIAIRVVGDIKTVANFINVRKNNATSLQVIDKGKAIIIVNKDDLSIELQLDPESLYGAVITGRLELSKELEQFSINKNRMFTKEELVKLIKFNKLFFADASKHAELVTAFMKVSSTVNIRANDSSDERGNKAREFIKDVETNAPTEFVLDIPIFKGYPASQFRVEICLDVTEGSVRFWFQSVELHELMQIQANQIFDDQLKAAEGFVIVNE